MRPSLSFLMLVLALHASQLSCFTSAAELPNIVLMIGDDVAYTDYGFMGSKQVETPHLDQLAREGLTYTRGYVPTSLCRASLMTILTGRYAHQHGVVGNDPPQGEDRAKLLWAVEKHPNIPRSLATLGYETFQSGKWWEGPHQKGGFTSGMSHGDPQRVGKHGPGRHGDDGLAIGRDSLAPIDAAIGAAKEKGKPFFIWYAPMLPHSPHDPPADLLAKYQQRTDSIHVARYWANCERFDRTIGEIREQLKNAGVADNTLIIYLHDNGWIQDPASPKFADRSKRSPYEGGARTPVILHWPRKIAPARDETSLVSSIDIAPTILSLVGSPPAGTLSSRSMPGVNLLEALDLTAPASSAVQQLETSNKKKLAQRARVFGENYKHDVASLTQPHLGLQSRWCIEGDWKLIIHQETGNVELFDLAADPAETTDLAGQHPDAAARLKKAIDLWWDGKQVATPTN